MITQLLKRKGVNVNDVLKRIEERKQDQEQERRQRNVKISPAIPIPSIFYFKPEIDKKIPKTKADFTDKKEKSLFKFLDDKGVEQPDKLLDFVRWFATPKRLRKPENQEKLAEKIGIHKDTFADWKKRTGFYKEVELYSNNFFRSFRGDIYYALVDYARKTGDPKAVKLYAQIFEGWSEKIHTQDEPREPELDPVLKMQIATAIKHIGLATIQEDYKKENN